MTSDDLIKELDEKGKLGWASAYRMLAPLGPLPANFSETIRALVSHYEHGGVNMSLPAQNQILRMLRNNTIKAMYYFVSQAYKPEVLQATTPLTPKAFLDNYGPMDHAAILSFCYLFRSLSKKANRDEWEYVQSPLYEALVIGACMGINIPEVGLGFGMFCRGLRYLSFAVFVIHNEDAFRKYRRHLKSQDLSFDLDYELDTWGCTNVQVAAMLLEYMGFNRTVAMQYVASAEKDGKIPADELYGIRFRMAEALLDTFMETGEILERCPEWVGKKFPFSVEVRGKVLTRLNQILSDDRRVEWLNKGSASINPDSTPEFFTGAQPG